MHDDFVIAVNPEEGSTLPYLLRVPLGADGVVLKARETWPRTSKVYCHRAEGWPTELEIVERVPVRSCERRGAAIDLVLDRGRENRSQFVLTRIRGGREVVFWQTGRTAKQARPNVGVPRARAAGLSDLEIVVDSHERYPYTFRQQQTATRREALPAGDYGVFDGGMLVASVERKSLVDLVASLVSGKLKYQLADLAALPRSAVVVEDRYSGIFKLDRVRPAVVADGLAELQVRWPTVPIVFCESRQLAEEWTYRYLGAARTAHAEEMLAGLQIDGWQSGGRLAAAPASQARMRLWAQREGLEVADRGRLRADIVAAYEDAHRPQEVDG